MADRSKRNGESVWRRLACGYDRLLLRNCRCESMGNRLLTVQGCCEILEYGRECILLSVRDPDVETLCICGRDLLCLSYHPDAIQIRGEISSVAFGCGEGGKGGVDGAD